MMTKGPRSWDMLKKTNLTFAWWAQHKQKPNRWVTQGSAVPSKGGSRAAGSPLRPSPWNLHSLNRNPERSFEELPSALWQKTGKQCWNQGLWGRGGLWEPVLKEKCSLWKMLAGWAQTPESPSTVLHKRHSNIKCQLPLGSWIPIPTPVV